MDIKCQISTERAVRAVFYGDIVDIDPGGYLSELEMRELAEKDERKRPGWLASRYAAKAAMGELFSDKQPWEFSVGHKANGQPVWQEMEGVGLSLSHSGHYGAAVVDKGRRVGVDIERVRQWPEETLRAFLTEEEYGRVMAMEGRERDLLATKYWAAKEAYLKALGVGLRRHPKTVSIQAICKSMSWAINEWVGGVVILEGHAGCSHI